MSALFFIGICAMNMHKFPLEIRKMVICVNESIQNDYFCPEFAFSVASNFNLLRFKRLSRVALLNASQEFCNQYAHIDTII